MSRCLTEMSKFLLPHEMLRYLTAPVRHIFFLTVLKSAIGKTTNYTVLGFLVIIGLRQ